MQVYDLLPQSELELITEYINAYGGIDGNGTYVLQPMNHILRFWNKNKEFLCTLLNGQLIIEKEIDIKRPEAIMLEDMENAMYNQDNPLIFVKEYNDTIYSTFASKNYDLYDSLRSLLDANVLITNYYTDYSFDVLVPGETKPIKVQSGCKIMKILSKLAKAFDLPGFEEFRIAHSMVLNQKRFKGTLCLSIHPLDYMTMSDNDCDWDSCMSWRNEGEYRLGTIEMMNSECVLVAYLKAEKDFKLFCDNDMTWNNKRWRELFIVTPEIMTAIKGYPYTDDVLRDTVFQWIQELMHHNYPQYEFYPEKYDIKNNFCVYFRDMRFNISLVLHAFYNDLYGTHPAYFSNQMLLHDQHCTFRVPVSGETSCIICGDDWSSNYHDWDTEMLICPECSGVTKCYECGEYVDHEDIVELGDGSKMCHWCAERYASSCAYCEDLFNDNSLTEVHLRHLGRPIGRSICLCDECYDSTNVRNIIGEIVHEKKNPWSWSCSPQVDTENLTDEGYQLFDFSNREIEEIKRELIINQLSG